MNERYKEIQGWKPNVIAALILSLVALVLTISVIKINSVDPTWTILPLTLLMTSCLLIGLQLIETKEKKKSDAFAVGIIVLAITVILLSLLVSSYFSYYIIA